VSKREELLAGLSGGAATTASLASGYDTAAPSPYHFYSGPRREPPPLFLREFVVDVPESIRKCFDSRCRSRSICLLSRRCGRER